MADWINPAAFAPPAGEFGNAPRNLLRGPGTWQIDIGAAKTFPLGAHASGVPRGVLQHLQSPAIGSTAGHVQSRHNPPDSAASQYGELNTAIVSADHPGGLGNAARDAVRAASRLLGREAVCDYEKTGIPRLASCLLLTPAQSARHRIRISLEYGNRATNVLLLSGRGTSLCASIIAIRI